MFSDLSQDSKNKIYIMIFFIILLVIFLIYLVLRYRYAKKNEPVIVYNKTPFNEKKNLRPKNITKSSEGIQTTYSTWLYINNAPENAEWNKSFKAPKIIISQGYSPALGIIPHSNKLILGITCGCKYYTYEIVFIPSQKWNHIVMVLNNRHVDFFINSKLYKSIMLPNLPDIGSSTIEFLPENDKLFGYIANTRYFNRILNKLEISTLYENNISNNPPTTKSLWWLDDTVKYPYILYTLLNFVLDLPENLKKILF